MTAAILRHLGGEGLRLFFPLAAVHAALWPLLWTAVYGLGLPLAGDIPSSLWHVHEIVFGAYGAAVIGFITTAVPEWSNSERLQGRPLYVLAGLWLAARVIGLTGAQGIFLAPLLGDTLWLLALAAYVGRIAWLRRRMMLLAFALWLLALACTNMANAYAFWLGDAALAQKALHVAGLILLGMLGLALSRITAPVTNLVLDPTETSAPFRPHPGRMHLAPGLVAIAAAAEFLGISPAVSAYLLIAAGAAFLDRMAEGFVGCEIVRTEILGLMATSLFAGLGLGMIGASRLGAPFAETPAWHLALMGGLGLGVLAVFVIAGLRHTGRPLGLSAPVRAAFVCAAAATVLRACVAFGFAPLPMTFLYVLTAALWAAAFLLWLWVFWPLLSSARQSLEEQNC